MNKVQSFIRKHGGTVKVSQDAKLKSPGTVSTWIKQKAIPFKHWQFFVDRGATWQEMLDLHVSDEAEKDEDAHAAA